MTETTKIYQSLADTFDVDDVVDTSDVTDLSLPTIPDDTSVESDTEKVRETLYTLLSEGADAFSSLKRIAKAEESPRSFEVLNSMLSNLSDIAVKLMDVHERKLKMQKVSTPTEVVNNGNVTNNTMFVGTTMELHEMLKKINME